MKSPEYGGGNEPKIEIDEMEVISTLADLRRRSAELKRMLLDVSSDEEGEGDLIDRIKKEADGVSDISGEAALEEIRRKESDYRSKALNVAGVAPNYSAYLFGYLAKLKQAAGEPFSQELEEAKKLVTRSEDLLEVNPDDLLAQAEILGVQRRVAKHKQLPGIEQLAKIAASDERKAKEVALVLDENDRETFLALLPKERQRKIAVLMDYELSKVLPGRLLEVEADKSQATAVKARTRENIQESLRVPEETTPFLMKATSKTLSELDSDDSKRLLLEVGKAGLAGEKDKDKQEKKNSHVARILKTLADIDVTKGGNLAMKFLAKKEVSSRIFLFFCTKLTKAGYLTPQIEKYLQDEKNLPFLRKLIATYPNQFNTVIDTIAQIKNYDPARNQEEVFSAIEDLDSLTPIIFNRYRQADSAGKKELSMHIRELKPKFFRNMPIKDILPKRDREIIAEMVYLAYKPVNMSFEKVQALINRLEDQTEDLRQYRFPENGYQFDLEKNQVITLRKGETIDVGRLREYRNMLSAPYPEKEKSIEEFSSLLNRLAKAGTMTPEELPILFGIMSRDELVINFTKRFENLNGDNVYNYLNELKEILGIYFKDNYWERMSNFLAANPTVEGKLMKVFSNPDRQKTLQLKLGKSAESIDWGKVTDKKEMARLLSIFIDNSILKAPKENINRNINKFSTKEGEKVAMGGKNLRAYISKNIGSFFAKASAGICTAEDIPLFERQDHFHINIVENDQYVRANIQAYLAGVRGGNALVLRGFNPNTEFLDKIDAARFCEKVLEVARQFQKDNHLAGVYITEQGSWHALSNREKVASYLTKRYAKQANMISYSLQVASSHAVSSIYKVG